MKPVKRWISVLMLVGVAAACNDSVEQDDPVARNEEEVAAFDNYLSGKGISAVKDQSGVRMVIYKLGAGFPAKPKVANELSVDYVGRFFPDGSIFDQGTSKYPLSQVIPGWGIALSTLPEGSRARIYIPSYWAYGTRGSSTGTIPPNTPLEFDIQFNKIVRTAAELQRLATDSVAVDAYLSSKGIEAIKDTVGIRYVVTQMGGGAVPGLYDKLKFKLTYRLMTDDTKVVAQSEWAPTDGYDSRAADQISDGVRRVLTTIPVGTKATVYIPSLWGFGPNGANDPNNNSVVIIPANANLIVDIELLEIVVP
jgi:FKBP-type peptidyl-prolyl cis-trans isomerase